MAKSVLVVNNPASVLLLFTALLARADEIWIERGASDKLDRGLHRALTALRIDGARPVRNIDTTNLFVAGRQKGGKIRSYRQIAAEIDAICRAEGVTEVICSTTSAFRMARVPRLHVVDHGTGDYVRTRSQTLIERMKYAWLYSGPSLRRFRYYAFLPLTGRTHLPLDQAMIRERVAGLAHPFAPDRPSVVLLVYPTRSLDDQLRWLHEKMGTTPYDVYLKGHHFDPQALSPGTDAAGGRPVPRMLPDELDVLPAEVLIWGFGANVRLAAFESTALWNIGTSAPDRVIALASRDTILGLPGPYATGLAALEADLGYSPFR